MTASTPATPDPRTETIRTALSFYHEVSPLEEALAALASLAAELAEARQALEQIARIRPDYPAARAVHIARAVLAGEDTT